jgi:hypothetical protein
VEDQFSHYVSGQLERVKTGLADVETDEFETTLDGASDRKSNNDNHGKARERNDYFEHDPYFSK